MNFYQLTWITNFIWGIFFWGIADDVLRARVNLPRFLYTI
jgi:hypothetical protein